MYTCAKGRGAREALSIVYTLGSGSGSGSVPSRMPSPASESSGECSRRSCPFSFQMPQENIHGNTYRIINQAHTRRLRVISVVIELVSQISVVGG